jgi:type VI protein secretion system component VasK
MDQSSARRPRRLPIWARLASAPIIALGTFCLAYHLVFWFFWRFLFGEEVWPWPPWSVWLLVSVPAVLAIAATVFLIAAKVKTPNLWIALGIALLAVFGLLAYGTQVWKLMFKLGFAP